MNESGAFYFVYSGLTIKFVLSLSCDVKLLLSITVKLLLSFVVKLMVALTLSYC